VLEQCSQDRLHVVFFDDLSSDPGNVYRQILDFLDLPTDHRREFPVVNAAKHWRNLFLANLVQNPPFGLNRALRAAKKVLGIEELGWSGRLQQANTRTARRKPLTLELRSELASYFAEDMRLISRLTGRDVAGWLPSD